MSLIRKINDGNSVIEIYTSELSIEEQKKNLINLYQIINEISDNQEKKGINTSDWFYTQQELQEMRKSGQYKFLKN